MKKSAIILFLFCVSLSMSIALADHYKVYFKGGSLVEYDKVEIILDYSPLGGSYSKCYNGSEAVLWQNFKIEKIICTDDFGVDNHFYPNKTVPQPTNSPAINHNATNSYPQSHSNDGKRTKVKINIVESLEELFSKLINNSKIGLVINVVGLIILLHIVRYFICWLIGTREITKAIERMHTDLMRQHDPDFKIKKHWWD